MNGIVKHGHSFTGKRSDTYNIWCGIRSRCNNPTDKAYPRYGGRGIFICKRWGEYLNFLSDMGERPSKKHSVDRIDNDGHYCPENCRWATTKQQCRNQSRTIYLAVDGVRLPAAEWCEKVGLAYDAFFRRYRSGWTDYECVYGRPPTGLVEYEGVTKTLREWADSLGVSYRTIARRWYHFRWSPQECLFGKKERPERTEGGVPITYKGKTQSMNKWCSELGLSQATVYGRYRRDKDISDPEKLFRKPRPLSAPGFSKKAIKHRAKGR